MPDTEEELRITYEEDKTRITRIEEEGSVSKRRLAGIMGAATTAAMVLLIVTFSLGMVGAALGVGLGGFVANFDTVTTTNNATIYPVLSEQAACEHAPQLEANLDGKVVIDGSQNPSQPAVEFFKDLPLPSAFVGPNGNDEFARITIAGNDTTENITAFNLNLRLTALEAQDLKLGENATGVTDAQVSIAEFNSTGGSAEDAYAYNDTAGVGQSPIAATDFVSDMRNETEFGIAAKGFQINQGSAAAHQVTFDGINLQDVNIAVQILNGSTNNSVVNPSSPSTSGCDALSNYAELDDQPYQGEETDVTTAEDAGIQLDDSTAPTEDDADSPRSNEFSGIP